MVMMSKECFISQYKNEPYINLLKVRDKLIKDLKIYEGGKNKINSGMIINPSPEAVYSMNLQYLAELCNLISKKFTDKIH